MKRNFLASLIVLLLAWPVVGAKPYARSSRYYRTAAPNPASRIMPRTGYGGGWANRYQPAGCGMRNYVYGGQTFYPYAGRSRYQYFDGTIDHSDGTSSYFSGAIRR